MDSYYRPTYIEVSLDALDHNIKAFRQSLAEDIAIVAVVKADAYGHGAVEISKQAIRSGADYLAVAFLDEALELRQAGIDAPILALGYTPPEGLELARRHGITINVYSPEVLEAMALLHPAQPGEASALKVHVKIDSGMGRLGLHREDEAIAYIDRLLHMPGIEVEGLFTHYANADELDKTYTLEQHRKFTRVVNHFQSKGVHFRYIHAGNSAAAIDTPELTYNMARLGISMYGLYPSDEVARSKIELKPVLSLKTGIVHLKTLPPGSGVSYGTKYYTTTDEKIATLPIGYADGFSRMLSGKAQALIRGHKVPIVGRICMDQCMANVSEVPDVSQGDEVTLIGTQGGHTITVEEVADQLGTINYEIICMISHRVPRVYTREGRVVQRINPLLRHVFHTFTM
ncbi:alanine racemase [Paenibacillus chartarius]|uniref:Alanine racemase n=1 Tax=Paenibacillus chartarius TaxID=747481 RepID=A0ABV6DKQ6_9BACL